jgi:release factor glutamine methyltransferase
MPTNPQAILSDVLQKTITFFKEKKLDSPRLDAELIFAHVLGVERIQLYAQFNKPLGDVELEKCRDAVRRRAKGEPVAYIVGHKWFYQTEFIVDANVLIPRPETEMIVEEVLKFVEKNKILKPRILDLGAGTGCIGFSIASELNKKNVEATVVSVEKSVGAFRVLEKNKEHLKLRDQVQLINSDTMTISLEQLGLFDVIVANPPYIDRDDTDVAPDVISFEPHQALFAEQQGFQDIFNWSQYVFPSLKTDGLMIFEMGCTQGHKSLEHFRKLGFKNALVMKDLAQLDRFVVGFK